MSDFDISSFPDPHLAIKPLRLIFDGRHLLWRTSDAFSDLFIIKDEERIATGGIYGFLNVLIRVYLKYGGQVVITWEGKNNFRYDLYPQYKKRAELDEDKIIKLGEMRDQEKRIKMILRSMGVKQYYGVNCEADDVMGVLAERWTRSGEKRVIIYTGDSDLRQLVTYYTKVISPVRRGKDIEYDTSLILDKYGFKPSLIADLKALAGDSSDNIPGVKGIGDKTAKVLIERYGNIRRVIKAAKKAKDWPVAERFRKSVLDNKKNIKLFKKLTMINTKATIKHIGIKENQTTVVTSLRYYKFFSLSTHIKVLMKMGKRNEI